MAYVNYDYFLSLYCDKEYPEEERFDRIAWEACRVLDIATTGIDGVKKLKQAFPTDKDDAETVRRCACKLIDTLLKIESAEQAAQNANGYITREDGTVMSKLVTSVSAGNESISYATGSTAAQTMINEAATDLATRNLLLNAIIEEYLSGISDANGVNLLYMGRYPPYKLE